MDLLTAHRKALEEFDRRVRLIQPAQWRSATPCTEWTVRDLLNHLVGEQRWAPSLLAGATIADVGDRFDGDQLGADPLAAWTEASGAARAAWEEPGATERQVHLSRGPAPAEDYGWEMAGDLAVHAWDLAHGIGADPALDPELAEVLYERWKAVVPLWVDAGIFAPPVPVPAGADPQIRLIALTGRRP